MKECKRERREDKARENRIERQEKEEKKKNEQCLMTKGTLISHCLGRTYKEKEK